MITKNLTILDEFMKIFILAILLPVACSCSLFTSSESGSYKKSATIHNHLLEKTPAPWVIINNETSDFAITNTSTRSVFILNSACRKFEANNLNSLTTAMLAGVEVIRVLDKKIISYQARDAMDMTVLGKVDGVERFFHLMTIQKNNCIYDFVLISTSEKNLNNDNNDFLGFIQRIEIN
jgi:hypothetical protein